MATKAVARQIAGVAALEEPARRALYDYVVERGGGVSRDQAAAGAGISRALAAFHLDRLVEAGLRAVEFRRLTGRTGPGAGRPAKLYSRASGQVAITLPPRSYGVAAELFAEALDSPGGPGTQSLPRLAREFGGRLGAAARGAQGGRERAGDARALLAALESLGYEPTRSEDGEIRLRNCPFHALTERHRELVCGTNVALLAGVLGKLQPAQQRLEAVLDPKPGMCCVALRPVRGKRKASRTHPKG